MINYNSIRKELKQIKEKELIKEGEKILIAFSGGPDSVFLYYVLRYLKKSLNIEISLIYINHGLRTDVENDIKFVKNFSKINNVPLYIKSVDVKSYAKKNKKSVELSARELRYEELEKKLKEINYDKIATGHNLDDNVETVIFRLLRGTSLKGLKGIPEIRGEIIRPILNFEKRKIVSFLNENKEEYVTDHTNNEIDYTRNYIRNELFPLFSKVNSGFRKKINGLIAEVNEEDDSLNKEKESKKNLISLLEENNVSISRQKINQIYNDFFNENGTLKKEGSKEFYIGNGTVLRKTYSKLEIIKRKPGKNADNKKSKKFQLKKNQSLEWYTYRVEYFENKESLKKLYKEDTDKIKTSVSFFKFNFSNKNFEKALEKITIRKREEGDRIFISNIGNKKIKKILIDEKISKWKRDEIPIIELETENNSKIILSVGDLKHSEYLEKIEKREIERLQKKESILVIRRKDEQQR